VAAAFQQCGTTQYHSSRSEVQLLQSREQLHVLLDELHVSEEEEGLHGVFKRLRRNGHQLHVSGSWRACELPAIDHHEREVRRDFKHVAQW
jgi:hypothetical protein